LLAELGWTISVGGSSLDCCSCVTCCDSGGGGTTSMCCFAAPRVTVDDDDDVPATTPPAAAAFVTIFTPTGVTVAIDVIGVELLVLAATLLFVDFVA
jgi:hypothetical protein